MRFNNDSEEIGLWVGASKNEAVVVAKLVAEKSTGCRVAHFESKASVGGPRIMGVGSDSFVSEVVLASLQVLEK